MQQRPEWWYERWGVREWAGTLFSQPVEIHAFLLGLFIGAAIGIIASRGFRRIALSVTFLVILFILGAFGPVGCNDSFTACEHLQIKPWYFMGGFVVTSALSVGIQRRMHSETATIPTGDSTIKAEASNNVSRPFPKPIASKDSLTTGTLSGETQSVSGATALTVILVSVLLILVSYSFVSPTPIHPITGLATAGGFLGSTFGLAAYRWAVADSGDGPGYLTTLRRLLSWDRRHAVFVISYGTVFGFGYPRIIQELESWLGQNGFIFGPIHWEPFALASIALYVSGMFSISVLRGWLYSRNRGTRLDGNRFAALVFGYATYVLFLFFTTGYAGRL